jgi:hypothetical protein
MSISPQSDIHKFLDRDEDTSIVNQFYKLLSVDREKAADFLKTHSNLSDEKINHVIALSDDPDDQDGLRILLSDEADFRRTRQEISDAWQQVWDRRWYGRGDSNDTSADPELLSQIAAAHDRMEKLYGDLNDRRYYEQYGWGYLAGIQSALGWVMGDHWAMLDT